MAAAATEVTTAAKHHRFEGPVGVAVDADDAIYVADAGHFCVKRISPQVRVLDLERGPNQRKGCAGERCE